jgi:hypothetical protein
MDRLVKDGAVRRLCIVGHIQRQELNNNQRLASVDVCIPANDDVSHIP